MNNSAKTLLAGFALGLTAFALIACADGTEHTETPAAVEIVTETPDMLVTVEGVPVPAGAEVILEDDPRFDCRFDGNQACGTQIEGVWYVVQFEDGTPMTVTVRANQ